MGLKRMPIAQLKRQFPALPHTVKYLGNGFFEVGSASAPGETYAVELRPRKEGGPLCTCKGFDVRKWCTHIRTAFIWAVEQSFADIVVTAEEMRRE